MRGSVKYSRSFGMGWGAELLAVFVSGFLVATILCVALWFFLLRPAQSAAARTNEAALQERETALLNCAALRNQCDKLKDKVQVENQQLDAKLKEALVGWGRCIKSKNATEAQGNQTAMPLESAPPRPHISSAHIKEYSPFIAELQPRFLLLELRATEPHFLRLPMAFSFL